MIAGLALLAHVDKPSRSVDSTLQPAENEADEGMGAIAPDSNIGHRLTRDEMVCFKVPEAFGGGDGVFKQASEECSERYSVDIECNGYQVRLARVERSLHDWDTLAYIRKSASTDAMEVPYTEQPEETRKPVESLLGKDTSQATHNAGVMCEHGKLVLYGGRFHWGYSFGSYAGLLKFEGSIDDNGITWSKRQILLDGTTMEGFNKTRDLNCQEGRTRFSGVCTLDGKLSLVGFQNRTCMYARLNVHNNGYRHVQMSCAPSDDPTAFEQFQPLEFDGYEIAQDNNIYYTDVQNLYDVALLAIFPAVMGKEAGIFAAFSTDGVHFGKPTMLLSSTAHDDRSEDHPVDGFRLTSTALRFDIDHGIELGRDVSIKDRDAGVCRTPYTCTYEISGTALKKLHNEAWPAESEQVRDWLIMRLQHEDQLAQEKHVNASR